jgi:YVTN family beta-propeller protein
MTGHTRATVAALSATLASLMAIGLTAGPAASRASGGIAPIYERTIGAPGVPTIGPSGISVDPKGNLYVADTANSQVEEFGPTDSLNPLWRVGTLGQSGPGNFSNPRDVAVDAAHGLLFVADTGLSRVQVLSAATGASKSVWSTMFKAAMGIHVGVSSTGTPIVLVADATLNRIDLFTETGTLIRTIGATSGAGLLNQPRDAATDIHGNIYVADFKNSRVVEFSPTGAVLRQWGGWAKTVPTPGKFRDPYGITLDQLGRVYVSDNQDIQEFTPTGTYIQEFGSPGTGPQQFFQLRRVAVGAGTTPEVYGADLWGFKVLRFSYTTRTVDFEYGNGQNPPLGTLNQPYGLTMTPGPDLYVADTNNQRVQEFDPPSGTPLLEFGHRGFGSDTSGVNWPRDVTYDATTNTLWVADTKNFRLLQFNLNGTSSGHPLGSQGSGIGQLNWVYGLAMSGSDLVVADTFNNRVQLWDPATPTTPVLWTATGFNNPRAVAVANGDVYVADTKNNQIVVLNATTGAVVQTLATGQITDPEGIAVTALGNIWLTSGSNNQLVELDPTGKVIETYGGSGSANGQFNHPAHLILSMAGTDEELYVMDSDNGRCQVFSVTGS